jgi:Arc/MetJ-type ribon-helix-helix transcriptional regulator
MEKRIIFRLPERMHEQITEAVKQGKAKTPSQLIRLAISKFFEDSGSES